MNEVIIGIQSGDVRQCMEPISKGILTFRVRFHRSLRKFGCYSRAAISRALACATDCHRQRRSSGTWKELRIGNLDVSNLRQAERAHRFD